MIFNAFNRVLRSLLFGLLLLLVNVLLLLLPHTTPPPGGVPVLRLYIGAMSFEVRNYSIYCETFKAEGFIWGFLFFHPFSADLEIIRVCFPPRVLILLFDLNDHTAIQ